MYQNAFYLGSVVQSPELVEVERRTVFQKADEAEPHDQRFRPITGLLWGLPISAGLWALILWAIF